MSLSCLDYLYAIRSYEKLAFARGSWCGPRKLRHATSTLIARYSPTVQDDGHEVEVYCTALPARFYEIRAKARIDSMGYTHTGFTLATGSGQHELAAKIAEALANGMLARSEHLDVTPEEARQ